MKFKIIFFIMSLLTVVLIAGCFKKVVISNTIKIQKDNKLDVIVSFNPMKEFASEIGGDKINLETIVPTGTEPHDFEPKYRDMVELSKAKLFIYNGLGMEAWADQALAAVDNKRLIIVNASEGCNYIKNISEDTIREHGSYDPHVWLSLREAKIEAGNIRDGLIKADPENSQYYEKNYEVFVKKIDGLYNEYKVKFAAVRNRNFITGHAAFAYFCRDFGLQQNSVEDVFAEGEPGARRLQELIDYCRLYRVNTIFVEEMVSPKVSQTLAAEVGAKVKKIYTVESSEEGRGYIETMRENLEMVYDSLK